MTLANNGRKKRKPAAAISLEGPNKFRLRHAEGSFEVGDDRQGSRVYTMVDTPLARAHARGAVVVDLQRLGRRHLIPTFP